MFHFIDATMGDSILGAGFLSRCVARIPQGMSDDLIGLIAPIYFLVLNILGLLSQTIFSYCHV